MARNLIGLLVILALGFFVIPLTVEAQPAKNVHRIGLLSAGSPLSDRANVEAFQQGLRALGYVEGQNLVIEYRYAEGQAEQLPELVRLEVEVMVAGGAPTIRAAQHAGQCGVEVEGGRVPTPDWMLNLQILTSGGFR